MDVSRELSGLDLNLLVVVHVLLEEQNVSRAALRLGRTQSATSRALARARATFDDPLLVRTGRGMRPTPRAERLRPALRAALGALVELTEDTRAFDPARATRRFVVAGPDALASVLQRVVLELSARAPRCTLELRGPPTTPAAGVLGGGIDIVIGAAGAPGGELMRAGLGVVRWVTLMRQGHPLARGRMTLKRWRQSPHVQVISGTAGVSAIDRALEALGQARELRATVPGSLAALHLVASSDFIVTVPDALAAPLLRQLNLVERAPPLPLPEIQATMWWSPRVHDDEGHRFLRQLVANAAASATR